MSATYTSYEVVESYRSTANGRTRTNTLSEFRSEADAATYAGAACGDMRSRPDRAKADRKLTIQQVDHETTEDRFVLRHIHHVSDLAVD